MNRIFANFFLWGGWLILPIILEMTKNIWLYIRLTYKANTKKETIIDFKPVVTVLIPVYNSSKTLKMCLESLTEQTYDTSHLEVFLLNNGKRDESYEIFQKFQNTNEKLRIWWMDSSKGKASALNKGLFNSTGKYIINIDSDGWLDENAIENVVKRFEGDSQISSLTGVVLIDPKQIEDTKKPGLKLLQKAEFVEYVEAFLIGRNHQSSNDALYTLAGAFSCFRKEVIHKTQLYNPQTLGEDTHMTFQIRKFIGGKIELCEDAILYVDPIESIDKLYMQRQRWQRSTMEIAMMFKDYHVGNFIDFFKKSNMRLLMKDHTIAFINLFWTFSFIYFYFVGYPMKYYLIANSILAGIYSLNSLIYNRLALKFTKSVPSTHKYLKNHWWVGFFMVPYRTLTYLIRISGLINSLTTEAEWFPRNFSDEVKSLKYSFTFGK